MAHFTRGLYGIDAVGSDFRVEEANVGRMVLTLTRNAARPVVVFLRDGSRVHGILAEGPVGVGAEVRVGQARVLTDKAVSHGSRRALVAVAPQAQLRLAFRDLVDVQASPLTLAADADEASDTEEPRAAEAKAAAGARAVGAAARAAGFKTDTDISRRAPVAHRPLQAWTPESAALEPVSATAGAASAEPWDQFAANERLFGATTTYDEELYTTRLDRSAPDFEEKMRNAEVIAEAMLRDAAKGPLARNRHVQEERGEGVADSGDGEMDEEDRYGAVLRGSGASTTPSKVDAKPAPAKPANGYAAAVRENLSKLPATPSPTKLGSIPEEGKSGERLENQLQEFVSKEKVLLSQKKQAVIAATVKASISTSTSPATGGAGPGTGSRDRDAKQQALRAFQKELEEKMSATPKAAPRERSAEPRPPAPGAKVALPEIPTYEDLMLKKKLKEKKKMAFNPNASAFVPGVTLRNTGASPSPTPVPKTPTPVPVPGPTVAPSATPLSSVRNAFTPFKHGRVPDSESVDPTWNFTGRPFRDVEDALRGDTERAHPQTPGTHSPGGPQTHSPAQPPMMSLPPGYPPHMIPMMPNGMPPMVGPNPYFGVPFMPGQVMPGQVFMPQFMPQFPPGMNNGFQGFPHMQQMQPQQGHQPRGSFNNGRGGPRMNRAYNNAGNRSQN